MLFMSVGFGAIAIAVWQFDEVYKHMQHTMYIRDEHTASHTSQLCLWVGFSSSLSTAVPLPVSRYS